MNAEKSASNALYSSHYLLYTRQCILWWLITMMWDYRCDSALHSTAGYSDTCTWSSTWNYCPCSCTDRCSHTGFWRTPLQQHITVHAGTGSDSDVNNVTLPPRDSSVTAAILKLWRHVQLSHSMGTYRSNLKRLSRRLLWRQQQQQQQL